MLAGDLAEGVSGADNVGLAGLGIVFGEMHGRGRGGLAGHGAGQGLDGGLRVLGKGLHLAVDLGEDSLLLRFVGLAVGAAQVLHGGKELAPGVVRGLRAGEPGVLGAELLDFEAQGLDLLDKGGEILLDVGHGDAQVGLRGGGRCHGEQARCGELERPTDYLCHVLKGGLERRGKCQSQKEGRGSSPHRDCLACWFQLCSSGE